MKSPFRGLLKAQSALSNLTESTGENTTATGI
jgi:hypothetical protein